MLVDFSSSVADSRSRAFRKSFCAQEKIPTKLHEYALGGIRTHETDIYIPGSKITWYATGATDFCLPMRRICSLGWRFSFFWKSFIGRGVYLIFSTTSSSEGFHRNIWMHLYPSMWCVKTRVKGRQLVWYTPEYITLGSQGVRQSTWWSFAPIASNDRVLKQLSSPSKRG